MICFEPTQKQADLKARVDLFIREKILPLETTDEPEHINPEFRERLIKLGTESGLLAPHAPVELGGLGLSHIECATVFSSAGYSLFGPVALNIAAPDEGNINLLAKVATEHQKERWLRPLVAGEIRSCFAMTEPAPGAGSDPSALQTTAITDGDYYIVSGTKWFITGAEGASFVIIMAKSDDGGATMLLADMDSPGVSLERNIPTTDRTFPGGHGVLKFNNVRIPKHDVLGEPGQGFRYAQVRLAPARLTHCMRWLGAARRAHDIATEYAKDRQAFGKTLIEHEGVGFMLADNEIDLRQCELSILHTAWLLDQGEKGTKESSMTKVYCSEALNRVVDRSQQILGAIGVSHETVVARIATEIRAFRIYDGPSEVHRWSIAGRLSRT